MVGMTSASTGYVIVSGAGTHALAVLSLIPSAHLSVFAHLPGTRAVMAQQVGSTLVARTGPHTVTAWQPDGRLLWRAGLALPAGDAVVDLFRAGPNVIALVSVHHGEAGAAVGLSGASGHVLFRTPVLQRFWGGLNTAMCGTGSTAYLVSDFVRIPAKAHSGSLVQSQRDTVFAISTVTGKILWQHHVSYSLKPLGSPPDSCLLSVNPVVATDQGLVVQTGRNSCTAATSLTWTTSLLSAKTGAVVWKRSSDDLPAVSNGTELAEVAPLSTQTPGFHLTLLSLATGRVLDSIPFKTLTVPRFAGLDMFVATTQAPPNAPACLPGTVAAGAECASGATTEYGWNGTVLATFHGLLAPPFAEQAVQGAWYAQTAIQGEAPPALLAYDLAPQPLG